MKIVPARVEEQANRVDRTWSLVIGIVSALVALWCLYSILSLLYAAAVLSSYGWSPVSLIFYFVVYGVIGALALVSAVAFLTRYTKGPQ